MQDDFSSYFRDNDNILAIKNSPNTFDLEEMYIWFAEGSLYV